MQLTLWTYEGPPHVGELFTRPLVRRMRLAA